MPAIFRDGALRFHFYSNEGDPREPIHIHVAQPGVGDAKLWLYPDVSLAYDRGFDARTLRRIITIVEARRTEIEIAWNDYFGAGN